MPKVIELTVELNVEKVSCPGVWLCQDGRVSLNIFALGTTYHTCLLPPIFPLCFRDVFYFRKRFHDTSCSLNNICCLLKDETIYCELVQFCNDCCADECTVLAQYLGALNDVLFPPNMCTNEGVDLLMRRSSEFPGILSPKIEITTKMRVDEVYAATSMPQGRTKMPKPCKCPNKTDAEAARQKQVCHTPLYHRIHCTKRSGSRSRSRGSRSDASRSLCSINVREPQLDSCECASPMKSRGSLCGSARKRYQVYTAPTPSNWISGASTWGKENRGCLHYRKSEDDVSYADDEDQKSLQRIILESHYIEQKCTKRDKLERRKKSILQHKTGPCVCEICRKYHQLFLSKSNFDSTYFH